MTWKPRGCFDERQANHVAPLKRLGKRERKRKLAAEKIAARIRKLRSMDYADYLATRHWLAIRKQAAEHHGHKCCRCGSTVGLQVHHRTYERRGNERMADLELLCRGCHENHHEGEKFGVFDPMTREFLSIVS